MAFKTIEEANEAYLTQAQELKETQEKLVIHTEGKTAFEKRITELQEFNQKLFLRITEPGKKSEEEKPEMSLEELAKSIKF